MFSFQDKSHFRCFIFLAIEVQVSVASRLHCFFNEEGIYSASGYDPQLLHRCKVTVQWTPHLGFCPKVY